MNVRLVLSRAAIFIIVYSFVLGTPLLIGFYQGFGFSSFIILFLFSTFGPLIFRFLQGKADNILLQREKHYQRFLKNSTITILREKNLSKLLDYIVYILQSSVGVTFSGLYLLNGDTKSYSLSSYQGLTSKPVTVFKHSEPFIKKMTELKRPITSEIFSDLFIEDDKKVELLIPAFSDNEIICFIALGEKINTSAYTKHDINTFEIFANQISLAIENCIFLQEKERIRERDFQAEKLAFIGGMAEGVAHRIKNRLNHFSLAAVGIKLELKAMEKNFPDPIIREGLKKTSDSLLEIADSIIDNVIRTDLVIQGIINYAHAEETENFFSKIFFDEIIKGAKDLVRIKHEMDEFPILVTIDSSNIIHGIKPQLIECLYNLLDNSLEAIDEKIRYNLKEKNNPFYKPQITITLTHLDNYYSIEVHDNGIGIKAEDKNKIFAPYYTTKSSFKTKAFSGFGLFIVKRMIEENHKGKIWFESEYLDGTTFYIQIPALGHQENSNLPHPAV